MSPARRSAVGSSSPWATTWFTRPSRWASAASMKFPVRLISRAFRSPTAWGRRAVSPPPGWTPTRAWVSPKAARSEATRKAHWRASSRPPVTAGPLTAPMTGVFIPPTTHHGEPLGSRTEADGRPLAPASRRSSPAQKAGSAPVRTTARTSGSSSAAWKASTSRSMSSEERALRAAGRLSVSVRMPPAVSTSRTGSIGPTLGRGSGPHGIDAVSAGGGRGLALDAGQELQDGLVEVRGRLQHEAVAGALQRDQPGARDDRGDLGGVGRGGQRVLRADHNQRGDRGLGQAAAGVLRGAQQGLDLAVEGVGRLLEDDRPQQVDEQPQRPGGAGAEQPGEGPAGPGVHAVVAGGLLPAAEELEPPRLMPAGGAGQRQRPDPVGVLHGQ